MYPRGNFFSVTKGNSRRSKPTDESIGGFVGFEVFGVGYDFTSAEFDPIIRLLGVKKFISIIMKSIFLTIFLAYLKRNSYLRWMY